MFPLLMTTASATMFPAPIDLEELAATSDAAVFGVVQRLAVEEADGVLWTVATVVPTTGPGVEMRLLGGCRAGVCMTVAGEPRVTEGETVLVFLHGGRPTHFSEGLFHVSRQAGWNEPVGIATLKPGLPTAQAPLSALIAAAGPLLPSDR